MTQEDRSKAPALPTALVVGAGPTGLTVAAELARHGASCRIIDATAAPNDKSRAIAIQARTLELFEMMGVVDPFLAQGNRAHAVNIFSHERRIARIELDPLDSRYPYLLILDQSATERILTAALDRFGVSVERATTLVSFSQDETGVTSLVRRATGEEETIRTAYLVGCDGAHSTVRRELGLAFEGKTYRQTFLLSDVHLQWDQSESEAHIFTSDQGILAIFPLGGGRHRLIAELAAGGGGAPSAPSATSPSIEECQAVVEQRSPFAARVADMRWSSYFAISSRMVGCLQNRRVFVAGDAAHIHSPAGGQGMNTGIQEAINLAWKMALVASRRAPGALLESYHAERHPIERAVLRQTDLMVNVAAAENHLVQTLRDHLAPLFTGLAFVQDQARHIVSELAINYEESSLSEEHPLHGAPHAGARAPDAVVSIVSRSGNTSEARNARIYELLTHPWFTLLLFVDDESDPLLGEISGGTRERFGDLVAIERVRCVTKEYGTTRPAAFLVRPDGYIGWRGSLVEGAARLDAYLLRLLVPSGVV